jgi:AmmeMemoRadiSam system protein B
MQTRKPIVAGQFYPGQNDSCIDRINECRDAETLTETLPETIVAGIVPHAGWTFSGPLAALVFSAIKQQHEKVHTFIIFGAAHGYFGSSPAVYNRGSWLTPLGEVFIDEELAADVLSTSPSVSDLGAHRNEHSIEVQVPFIQYLFPGAKILPIIVPPREHAVTLGQSIGEIIAGNKDKKIICIGSTDLTHYGPRYGFTPMGVNSEALKWADNVNDQMFIDLALKLEPQRLLANTAENCNACGGGAAAATIAAAKQLGKTKGQLLAHTNSNEIMLRNMHTTSADSVGYAAIIF